MQSTEALGYGALFPYLFSSLNGILLSDKRLPILPLPEKCGIHCRALDLAIRICNLTQHFSYLPHGFLQHFFLK